jgi:hypothetical protein
MNVPRALVAALGLLLAPCPAFADGSKLEDARRAFAAGNQAYEAGKYLVAARAYESAYELSPLPSITFSMAQAYRRHYFEDADVQWLERAQSLYRRYLVEQPIGGRRAHAITHLGNIDLLLAERVTRTRAPEEKAPALTEILISSPAPRATASIDGAPPQDVPTVQRVAPGKHRVKLAAPGFHEVELDTLAVEGRLSILPVDLKAKPGSIQIFAPPDADVWVDGRFAARTPVTAALDLPAGRHLISISAHGRRPVSRVLSVERGSHQTLHVSLAPSDQRVAAYWTLGGAGLFALAGGTTAVLAAISQRQAEDARSGLGAGRALTPAEATTSNQALDRRDAYKTASLATFGVSALAGVTGTLLFVFDNPGPRAAERDSGAVIRGLSRVEQGAGEVQ